MILIIGFITGIVLFGVCLMYLANHTFDKTFSVVAFGTDAEKRSYFTDLSFYAALGKMASWIALINLIITLVKFLFDVS